jgi:hypothetical protein
MARPFHSSRFHHPHDIGWAVQITIPTRLENYDSSKVSVIPVKFLFTVGRTNRSVLAIFTQV